MLDNRLSTTEAPEPEAPRLDPDDEDGEDAFGVEIDADGEDSGDVAAALGLTISDDAPKCGRGRRRK